MHKTLTGAMVLAWAAAVVVTAQQAAPPQHISMADSLLRGYHNNQRNLLEAAEKMPDAGYTFKPTAETRPFSQLVAHVALSQFGSCAAMKGQPNPHQDDKEDKPLSKADAIALLKAATALCDEAFAGVTDANLNETVKVQTRDIARGVFVAGSNSHGNEMYGTMAVYLRLKGLVPPTTEREMQQRKDSK